MSQRRTIDRWRDAVWASSLPATSKLVAQALARYMSFEDLGSAYPGPARLSRETGLALRTVKAQLSALVDAGWIEQTFRGGSKPGEQRTASAYRGVFPSAAPVHEMHGSTGAPVQEMHGSTERTRAAGAREPVHLTTPTRAAGAHHHDQDHGQNQRRTTAGCAQAPPGAAASRAVANVLRRLQSRYPDDVTLTMEHTITDAFEDELEAAGFYIATGPNIGAEVPPDQLDLKQIAAVTAICAEVAQWLDGHRPIPSYLTREAPAS